jgi:hypothetical protein
LESKEHDNLVYLEEEERLNDLRRKSNCDTIYKNIYEIPIKDRSVDADYSLSDEEKTNKSNRLIVELLEKQISAIEKYIKLLRRPAIAANPAAYRTIVKDRLWPEIGLYCDYNIKEDPESILTNFDKLEEVVGRHESIIRKYARDLIPRVIGKK